MNKTSEKSEKIKVPLEYTNASVTKNIFAVDMKRL